MHSYIVYEGTPYMAYYVKVDILCFFLIIACAGGRGMMNSSLHDYATTGLRRWTLQSLEQWDQ